MRQDFTGFPDIPAITAIPQPEENEFLKVISQRDNGEI